MHPRGSIVLSQNAQHCRHSVCCVVFDRTAIREVYPGFIGTLQCGRMSYSALGNGLPTRA